MSLHKENDICKMTQVPRIIHLLWFDIGKGDQPFGKYAEGYEAWKRHHPNMEVKLWNREDVETLIHNEYYSFWASWNKLRQTIQCLDLARPVILHKYGGMYGDLDILCTRSVEPLFEEVEGTNKIMIMRSHLQHCPTNSFYICAPRHPFWLYMLDRAVHKIEHWPWFRNKSQLTVMYMSGTKFLGKTVTDYGEDNFIIKSASNIFPYGPMYNEHSQNTAYGRDHLVSAYGPWKSWAHDILRILLMLLFIFLIAFFVIGFTKNHEHSGDSDFGSGWSGDLGVGDNPDE